MNVTNGSLHATGRKSKWKINGNFIVSSVVRQLALLTAFNIALSFFALKVIFSETSIKWTNPFALPHATILPDSWGFTHLMEWSETYGETLKERKHFSSALCASRQEGNRDTKMSLQLCTTLSFLVQLPTCNWGKLQTEPSLSRCEWVKKISDNDKP